MGYALDRLMNDLRVRLPGALDDAIKLELFSVVDEFCKETNAWQEKIILPVHSGETSYEIEPEDNRAIIVRLLYVVTYNPDDSSSATLPVAAALPQPDLIIFALPPSDVSEYAVTVALAPIDPVNVSDGLPQFPDWFLILYSQELIDGVLARMMSQPAKPYFSREGFRYHGRRFRAAMSRVRGAVIQQNAYGAQTWRFPAFAPCNSR